MEKNREDEFNIDEISLQNCENNEILDLDLPKKRIIMGRTNKIINPPFKFFNNNDMKKIVVDDKNDTISANHCSINVFNNNFYLCDENSTNGTYIKVPHEKSLVLHDKMFFYVGNDNFIIETIYSNKITITYNKKECLELDFKNGNQVTFGFNEKNKRENSFFGFNSEDFSKRHIIFFRNEDFLIIAHCLGKYEIIV